MISGDFAHFWAWFGCLYLVLLTIQDFKNKMYVDDRYNSIMMGLSIALIHFSSRPIWLVFGSIFIIVILRWLLLKLKVIGEADINSLSWILFGFSIIDMSYLFMFTLYFLAASGLYYLFKLAIFKYKGDSPFYHVLLVAFSLTVFIFKLY